MSKKTEQYFRGIPTKPYDLLREGLIFLALMIVVTIVLAAVLHAPDYPTVTGKEVATVEPVAYLQTCATILSGQSSLQDYGPPYTQDTENSQRIFGLAPQNWFGVQIPINASQDFIIAPLEKMAVVDPQLSSVLSQYQDATSQQQTTWATNYLNALDKATVQNGQVSVPSGDYGPVPGMMTAMLNLGKSGLLEGAIESSSSLPYTTDFTKSLLFFQDDIDGNVADQLDITGDQWGVAHETGNYPGGWWLWPYAIWYHIPPMTVSANADIQAVAIVVAIFLILFFIPFIPVLNRLPRWIGIYRIIWRDWYSQNE